ncbi:MAG: GspH/FimT family pseudopilin [Pseudoxanthomonas sp.]
MPERGFTLVELMVTLTLIAILAALAAPSFGVWIKNSQVRTSAEALQSGLRTAQAEALRRSRQVVFSLTNSASPQTSLTATQDGKYWSINTVALPVAETGTPNADVAQFVESGVLGASGNGVVIEGPAAICFSSLGRLVVNSGPGVAGADCTVANIPGIYKVSTPGSDRPLRVRVEVGGQVRMCDPAKTMSDTHPDGCPPV